MLRLDVLLVAAEGEALGLGEGVVVARALLGHAGEDVVRRPVDDADDAAQLVAGQRLAQRAQDRDRAGDGDRKSVV